ncbi:hypothetical protein [uncultured Formosa sp.]|uniref:hypothetical protein n=1 Tax=uncultured Formosa sp. TaxID=255435 RepID=UPI0026394619|nr:hypothetical protein [uncultured Formosa sp.]
MKTTILVFLMIIGLSSESFACECNKLIWAEWNKEDVKESMEFNDVIFIAELVSVNKDYYEFKVLEVFKGKLKKNEIIKGFYLTSCSGWPKKQRTGEWIFYGHYEQDENDEKILNYSQCGPTRSLCHPPIYTKEQNIEYWNTELEMLNNKFNKKVNLKL